MKKSLLIAAFVFLSTFSNSFGQYRRLANVSKYGLDARKFEQILRMNNADVDIATAALILSERWSDEVQGLNYRDRIDEMAEEILDRLEQSQIPVNHHAVAVINKYLFEEMGFRSIATANDPEDLFIDSVIDKKRGYCLSLSVLYLSIAERLGLPIYGVVVPGHFFVRYDDGRVRFNIETTSGGNLTTDEYYIDKFKVPIRNGNRMYMKNLTNHETLGCYLNNLGNSYQAVNEIDTATEILEKAVRINPGLAESRNNLGNMYISKGLIDDAIRQYRIAIEINPNDSKSHNNLGNAYYRKGMNNKAIREYRLSIELDSNSVEAYRSLASAYLKIENFKQAIAFIKKAETLGPSNSRVYVISGSIYSEMGEDNIAIKKLIKALVLNPHSVDAHIAMAVAYKNLGDEERSLDSYRNALAIDSESFVALANLGNIYFENEQYEFASNSVYWLIVRDVDAKFQGTGTINDAGDYSFIVTLTDIEKTEPKTKDKIRIKIWDNADGSIVYDNLPSESDHSFETETIGNGSIVIHKKGSNDADDDSTGNSNDNPGNGNDKDKGKKNK